ncbi:CinA family protein [Desulfocurvus vexinensis]|uniref:CinA family protein n=1 Tax=Desulfocurvus vexinensis TaxID=399548 RepID=UPI0004B8B05C|nr:CinA family protein [Desulfocurvus vexinensis]
MQPSAVHDAIARLGATLNAAGLFLATAESCTGGLIASTLTDVPGSSLWFRGAVVAYANEVKAGLLGVPPELLAVHGAVSEPVVRAMALGAARALGAQCAVAVSGIAGPGGGSADKPVGMVWMAFLVDGALSTRLHRFDGSRHAVKAAAVAAAVAGLLERLGPGAAEGPCAGARPPAPGAGPGRG